MYTLIALQVNLIGHYIIICNLAYKKGVRIATNFMRKFLCALLLLVVFASCRKEYYNNDVPATRPASTYSGKQVQDYFNLLCTIAKSTPGFFPPQVARAYGYIGITAYEAVVPGITGALSLAGQLNGLQNGDLPRVIDGSDYDWAISSNAAIALMMRKMFETNINITNALKIDSTESSNLSILSQNVSPAIVDRSINFGKSIAAAIYNYSKTDGADKSYLDPFQLPFTMPQDDYCWSPTSAILHPVSPYWGNNRPFLKASVNNTQNFSPLTFSANAGSAFYQQALQVYKQVKANTADQVVITKYWADDPFNTCTPTGHTFNIITQLLQENKATLEKTSLAYAKLAIAENDAFIACWKMKYTYNLVRPVTYIRKYIDANFNTVIGTPPFPAFSSGHSAEIGAGSKIFINLFTNGSGDYEFTDLSQLQYGFSSRHYSNFNAMAQECADSRFYGGIHYTMDNQDGLNQGIMVGDFVNTMIVWPKNTR